MTVSEHDDATKGVRPNVARQHLKALEPSTAEIGRPAGLDGSDSQARLYRKSNNTAARLCYLGHLLIEHRHGLIIGADLTAATGRAERECAIEMLRRLPGRGRGRTVAGDKGYDTKDFVADVRKMSRDLRPVGLLVGSDV